VASQWSDATKRWVALSLLLVMLLLLYWARAALSPILIALLLAYILNPFVNFIARAGVPRTLAAAVVYLGLLGLGSLGSILLGRSLVEQILFFNLDLDSVSQTAQRLIAEYRELDVFGFQVDLALVYEQIRGPVEKLFTALASYVMNFAGSFAFSLMWLIIILVVSFYAVKDTKKITSYIERLVPPAYREDFLLLAKQVDEVWHSFFRGQLLLCLVVAIWVGVVMWALGVRNSVLLGIIAGLLETLPSIGPTIAAVPAVLIAYFQGSAVLPISNFWFALLIAATYAIIQQLENNYVAPRIIGGSVHLHPLVVICGAIIGARLMGLMGIFLAAPTLATLRVLGRYIGQKLLEVGPSPAQVAARSQEVEATPDGDGE